MTQSTVTVIIPTVGDERRAETIWRAIDSAGHRSGVETRVVVVVNGRWFSPRLIARLNATPELRVVHLDQESMPEALRYGRSLVDTEFFAFLDDDDEFLPGGLAVRLRALSADPALAFVITNGYFAYRTHEAHQVALSSESIESAPLSMLLVANWMATSASGLYRTAAVSCSDFNGVPKYFEWTYIGFQLAGRLSFRFLDEPTYRRYDVPGSVSKTEAYQRGAAAALRRILSMHLPPEIRNGVRRRLAAAHHDASARSLADGELLGAWHHHLRSLVELGGARYVLYTRRLLAAHFGRSNKHAACTDTAQFARRL